MIRFLGNLFESRIEDGNLILESLHKTFIFEGLGKRVEDEAEHEYWREGFKHQSWSSFLSEYLDSMIQYAVDTHKDEAQKVLDLSKNLN